MLKMIPNSDNWNKHIALRFAEAKEIGLFAPSAAMPQNSFVFAPDDIDIHSISDAKADQIALRDLAGEVERPPKDEWVLRHDLFEEASAWLVEECLRSGFNRVVCQAGYQQVGDKVLDARDHILWNGVPLYCAEVDKSEVAALTTMLRQGRTWRMLGAAIKWDNSKPYSPSQNGIFFCDIFDGDSLIVASV